MLLLYATGRIILGASLATSPWAVWLRVDADQYLTALLMMVQNKRGHLLFFKSKLIIIVVFSFLISLPFMVNKDTFEQGRWDR